jgi:hypothetical protein
MEEPVLRQDIRGDRAGQRVGVRHAPHEASASGVLAHPGGSPPEMPGLSSGRRYRGMEEHVCSLGDPLVWHSVS